jgi:aminopeptidase N
MSRWIAVLMAAAAYGGAAQSRGGASVQADARPEPGVSRALAEERVQRISEVRYTLSFSVPAAREVPITGRTTISFTLGDNRRPVVIDFAPNRPDALRGVEAGAGRIGVEWVNGHIVVPAAVLRRGTNVITIDFEAGDAPLNRNDDFLYTIFVPARAHEAFPCFDQPDLKARWRLALEVPQEWETVANGAEASRQSGDGRTRMTFDETQPISTYLFAFATGRFSIETARRDGRAFRMFHRETDAQKVERNLDAIFDLHAAALEWMERYTGIPYPFGKFDFALIPAFQFGGMEHPGAIFYNANGLLLDPSATENQKLDRASTIAHETTHMWFGDLVTMRWFDDVWMKEVFANYFAAKIVNPSFPNINHDLRFLLAYYPAAYEVDRTAGTNAIRQPLANLSEAGTLYGAIIYQKAPVVMRQLETLVGGHLFQEGIREYLRRYAFVNASWPELVQLMGSRTPVDLAGWSHAWVNEPGRPIVTTRLQIANGRIGRLTLSVRDPVPRRGLTWTEDLQVAIGYRGDVRLLPVRLSGTSTDVSGARGLPAPSYVLPSGRGVGYGEFHLDRASLKWLLTNLPTIGDPLTRGSAWVTLWDAMLDGEARADEIVDLAVRALPRETDELNSQRILAYLDAAYWHFTTGDRRSALAPRLERVLKQGLGGASTPTLKAAYFATLRNVALTPATVRWLRSIWREDERVPGLTLSENDFIQLAEELAIRGVQDEQAMLERQLERTRNPDRKARLMFVIPALSSDTAERDRFFESLKEVSNRRHEPWVLEGVAYLNHPLRERQSIKYITPSLELLRDIQRTGDIFFPKRFMDATLGGHRSRDAARLVRQFVDRLDPSYPDRLRRIILSSADTLFRASSAAGGSRGDGPVR